MENNLAKNLKQLRISKGLTQEQLAKKINKDYSTIGKWENGSRAPIMEDIIKLSDIFDVSLQTLIGGNFQENSPSPEYELNDNDHIRFKQILKEKKLMDTQENIDLTRLQDMLDLADKIEQLTNKEKK